MIKKLFEIRTKKKKLPFKRELYFKGNYLSPLSGTKKYWEADEAVDISKLNNLEFKAKELPDKLRLIVSDKDVSVPFYDGEAWIERDGQKVFISFYTGFNHDCEFEGRHHTLLLNPYQILMRASKTVKKFNLKYDVKDYKYLDDEYFFSFYCVENANKNLADIYNRGNKNLKLLLIDAMSKMIRELSNFDLPGKF
jgi:hypothetical protein